METWHIKVRPNEISSSSALKAGVGQRKLPFKDVMDEINDIIKDIPEDMMGLEIILRFEIKDSSFSVESLGPTSTELIRRFQRSGEGMFSREEAEQIYQTSKEWWDKRVDSSEAALSTIIGILKSFKEGYEG